MAAPRISDGESDGVTFQDHWQTWTVNRGYYGAVDPARVRWSIEWASEPQAREYWRRRDDITAIVARMEPERRAARLSMAPQPDGTTVITEYDFRRWTAVLPAKE